MKQKTDDFMVLQKQQSLLTPSTACTLESHQGLGADVPDESKEKQTILKPKV